MGERPSSPPTAPPAANHHALSLDETNSLWDVFRAGRVASCPRDQWPLALSVDGSSSYRLVCTHCGTASAWFEAATSGITVRSVPPAPADGDD